MIKLSVPKLNLFMIAVTVLFIAVFACVLSVGICAPIAVADEGLVFEISFDGTDWTLFSSGEEIAKENGDFFEPQNDNAVSVIFKRAIDSTLEDKGQTGYSVVFNLPDIGFTTSGSSVFDYTEKPGSFVIRGIYTPVISEDVVESLQFRAADGEFENYTFASESNGGLAFGQRVDVGNYYVRFVVYEVFTFGSDIDGKDIVYRVPRYSDATFCTVEKAVPEAPLLQDISVEYGTCVKDIANSLPVEYGDWTLSAEQTDSAIESADAFLHTRSEAYKIKFDYTPRNSNYKTRTGVEASVKIIPKTLRVVIGDAFSLIGNPINTQITYSISTPLVSGDSVDDLGVEINTDSVNIAVAGEYIVTAQFTNSDYVAYCMNANNVFIGGGLYTVYTAALSATAPEGVEFTVLLGVGFIDITLRIELCENDWVDMDFAVPMEERAYRFVFENSRGARVYPDGSYTVTWQSGALDRAKYVSIVLADESVLPLCELNGNYLTVDGNTDVIVFYIELGMSGLSAGEIAGIVLSVLVVLGFAAAVIIIVKNKRIYFKISGDILKNGVYERENDLLNGDSDKIDKKEE